MLEESNKSSFLMVDSIPASSAALIIDFNKIRSGS